MINNAGILRDKTFAKLTPAAGIFGDFRQTNYGAAKMGLVGLTARSVPGARVENAARETIAPCG